MYTWTPRPEGGRGRSYALYFVDIDAYGAMNPNGQLDVELKDVLTWRERDIEPGEPLVLLDTRRAKWGTTELTVVKFLAGGGEVGCCSIYDDEQRWWVQVGEQ
jgi:hypothetical protein